MTIALPAAACIILVLAGPSFAQAPSQDLVLDSDSLTVTGHFQGGANLVAEQNLFWNFSETVARAPSFDPDTAWLEAYAKPGFTFERRLGAQAQLYGGLSGVASMTLGTDAFAAHNTGRATLEEGYLGLRSTAGETTVDVSVGPRTFKAGTGMLIEAGGSSGFSRGALKLGPRRAWGFAALGQVSRGDLTGTAFYLDPNESPDNDNDNRLAGLDLRYDPNNQTYVGMTLGEVVESEAPYPQAAPGGIGVPIIIPGARDGLEFLNLYGRTSFPGAPNAYVSGELALERNDRIDLRASAARFQVGYTFADRRWKPSFSLGYQTFSGDDPDTDRNERFDPLYYEGNPSAWSTGTKSSMVFINSNVNAWQVAAVITPSPKDTVTVRVARIGVNELRSPIQFGQATRVEIENGVVNPLAGVTRHHLSDDVYVEYFRALSSNLFLTAGFGVSVPGAGIKSIVPDVPIWSGAYVNLIANY